MEIGMNAPENEITVQRLLVPLHRTAIDYVYEKSDAARNARHQGGKTVTITPLKYFNNGDRLVEVTVEGTGQTRKACVPKVTLAEAEAQFVRAREVARVAQERYREARDKVTQIRQRRRAYEARQAIDFSSFANETLNKIACGLGLPASLLRDAQSSYGSGATRQGDQWSRHRPDTDSGESGPPSEV